jgi:hypothetical protein
MTDTDTRPALAVVTDPDPKPPLSWWLLRDRTRNALWSGAGSCSAATTRSTSWAAKRWTCNATLDISCEHMRATTRILEKLTDVTIGL